MLARFLDVDPSEHATFEGFAASYNLWLLQFAYMTGPAVLLIAFVTAVAGGAEVAHWTWVFEPVAVFLAAAAALKLAPRLRPYAREVFYLVYGGVVFLATPRYAHLFSEAGLWMFIIPTPHVVTPMLLKLRVRLVATLYMPAVFALVAVTIRGWPSSDTASVVFPVLAMSALASIISGELLGMTARANWQNARLLSAQRDALEEMVAQRTWALSDLSAELATLREREREDLARDLHDHLSQQLTGVRHHLFLAGRNEPGALARVGELVDDIHQGVRDTVMLLGGVPLSGDGLDEQLQELVENARGWSQATVSLEMAFDRPPHDDTARTIVAVVREGLTNVRRHATSAQHVKVRVDRGPAGWTVLVEDDGREGAGDAAPGIGLRTMAARLQSRGGQLRRVDNHPTGTRIEAVLPSPEEDR